MVTWKEKQFFIDGEHFEIHGGSIHYFRSMPDRWYELLLKLKNAGLNTVETYCAWNLHEPQPGVYDFSGRLDLERFLKTAEELGLYVILRPGPYICAEWEFGGLPGWLLADESMRVRTREGEYLSYVKRYFEHLMPYVIPHLQTNGGNIILVAAENEYGSFGNDRAYMNECVALLKDSGVDVPIFTSDGHTGMFLDGGRADGCLCALDFGYDKGQLNEGHTKALRQRQPDAPILHVEFWIGMFSHWGKPAMVYSEKYVEEEIRKHLEQHVNFCLYMFHGGTNFGFTNGANYFADDPSQPGKFLYYPDVTSYDYDAVLTEWGEITPKYLGIQKAMSEYLGKELPMPEKVPVMSLGEIPLEKTCDLFDNLEQIGRHHHSVQLHHMEYYGQNFGYILYRTKVVPAERICEMYLHGLADRALIYFNGTFRGTLDRNHEDKLLIDGWMDEGGTLDILVENQGRINFGYKMDRGDRKGILESVVIRQDMGPSETLYNWDVYCLEMDDLCQLQNWEEITSSSLADEQKQPHFYKGTFRCEEKKDCFVHLDSFTKGFVSVNGLLLGRYWEIGPQKSLYLPGSILQEENEILIFDEKSAKAPVVSILDSHVLDSMKTDIGPETIV